MSKVAFIYDHGLSAHVLREDHVMRPTRLRYTYDLLEAYGAFQHPNALLVKPRPATEEELLSFHRKDYVEAVKAFSLGDYSRYQPATYNFSDNGDNPTYPGMYEAAALSTGASIVGAELLIQGKAKAAFNVSGGLHHAMRGRASGFCIFDDPVIAIITLLKADLKVAYVDIDAHHGDGVQDAFYDTDAVLTISLHESGRYIFPGTGEVEELGIGKGKGYSVNVPLAPYTDDEVYLWAFHQVAPPLLDKFRPDVLVTQLGMDPHFNDPITHLNLTVQGHGQVVKDLGQTAKLWLAVGGGGYDIGATARGWAQDYGIMLGVDLPDEIPASWRQQYGLERLRDSQQPEVRAIVREQARRFAERTVFDVKRMVFPFHGIG